MAELLRLEDAAELQLRGRSAKQLVDGSMLGAGVTIRVVEVDAEVPGAMSRPLHVHDGVGEFIWLLSGTGTLHCDAGEIVAKAGQGVFIPPDERHKMVPHGSETLRLLCVFGSGDIGARTRE